MEQLTILATVFLPLTFVTGFFGQNFSWLVGHIAGGGPFLIWGIGGLLLPLALLFGWLRFRSPSGRRRPQDRGAALAKPGGTRPVSVR